MKLYPLKFQPIFKYRIWGGNKLKSELGKKYQEENIGESWEISDVDGDETVVIDGDLKGYSLKQLINQYKGDFLGTSVFEQFGNSFPILIKFIDAKTPLSIQVHPSNEISKKRHNSFGKNEMWYVMSAENDAELIVGFDQKIDEIVYAQKLNDNSILDVLHHEKVNKGDTFYIPTGRVHAIGAGVLLAEIQQTSDITYRIYDYNRVDAVIGKKRELHTDLAANVIDYNVYDSYKTTYETLANKSNTLVNSPYFKTNIICLNNELEKDTSTVDSFFIYMCVEGDCEVIYNNTCYELKYGEVILIPSEIKKIEFKSQKATLIEIYM